MWPSILYATSLRQVVMMKVPQLVAAKTVRPFKPPRVMGSDCPGSFRDGLPRRDEGRRERESMLHFSTILFTLW